jgi:hypothetical protein
VLFKRSVTGRFFKIISAIRATFPPVLCGITAHLYQLAVNSDGRKCFAYKIRTLLGTNFPMSWPLRFNLAPE